MKVYDSRAIRNVGLIGHGDSGKTTLASAMLYLAGAVNRLGRVDDGNTVTDYDDDEISRQITINTAVAHCEWGSSKINLIDTPGYPAFILDAKSSLMGADSALLVVDSTAGVEVQSEKAWEFAEEHRLARAVVFNKLDRDRAGFERSLESVHKSFGRTVVPVQIPMGEEASFRGIIDLIGEKAYVCETDGSGNFQETAIPDELQEEAEQRREELIEMVAESDDDLMEKYFEEGTLTQSELVQGLHSFFVDRSIVPAFCVSAGKNMGVKQLMDAMVELFPNPLERTPVPGLTTGSEEEEVELSISPDGPVTAYVFKTLADPFAGRINLVKAITGTVKSDSNLRNRTAESNERLGAVHIPQGKSYEPVPELRPGDLGAVMKLKNTATGDTLSEPSARSIVRKVEFPEAAISFAVEPKSRGDEDKIGNAIARVIEEDPSISFRREAQTKEFLLSGTGQLHVEVTVAKLERKYGVHVILKPPKVPYRETITGTADVHGRHKKQTGGHGQFGDCKIRIEGLPRGSGFEFENKIFGGSIPRNFIPAVEKGIVESAERGFVAGYPVVDFKVTLYDGSYHEVDSSEMAFKIAGSLAFRKAMEQARPVLLEPIMKVEVYVPEENSGDIMGDLNSRRGRIQGMDIKTGMQVVHAEVPMAEMLNYAPTLTSVTGGRGSFHMEKSHYDVVPPHFAEKVIEEAKRDKK
jgi:elongation factor G